MLSRRAALRTLIGTIAAPAVIRTPGLLMPVRTIAASWLPLAYIHNGSAWIPFSVDAEPTVIRLAHRALAFNRANHLTIFYPMRRVRSGDRKLLDQHVAGDIIYTDESNGMAGVWHQDVRTAAFNESIERMKAQHAIA